MPTRPKKKSTSPRANVKYSARTGGRIVHTKVFWQGKEYFSYQRIILHQNNSLNENLFRSGLADVSITSPPYNTGREYPLCGNSTENEKYSAPFPREGTYRRKNCILNETETFRVKETGTQKQLNCSQRNKSCSKIGIVLFGQSEEPLVTAGKNFELSGRKHN